MSRVEILVGMIASGKSTYARKRAKDGWIVINDDAIVTAVHGGDYTLYDDNLRCIYKSMEMHLMMMAIARIKDIVIDRGLNISTSSRQRFISTANSMGGIVEATVFPRVSPEEHAVRRFNKDHRNKTISHWRKVAERHNRIWEDPTREEGFRSIRIIPNE